MLDLPVPLSHIGEDPALARDIQAALIAAGYLDPPVDGLFGNVSQWALAEYGRRAGISSRDALTEQFRSLLFDAQTTLPEPRDGKPWVMKVIAHMRAQNHWICRHPECWNIVYVEGVDPDGTPNADTPNQFNDVRLVFQIGADGAVTSHAWEGTCEPGRKWTMSPSDRDGAARIAFGQYKAWGVGMHPMSKRSGQHEALVQRFIVPVHRDFNKDFKRTGDKVFADGIFGINQHWGYDLPVSDIGGASAGCLVGRTKEGHKEFMRIIKTDARYKALKGYTFMTAVLDGGKIGL